MTLIWRIEQGSHGPAGIIPLLLLSHLSGAATAAIFVAQTKNAASMLMICHQDKKNLSCRCSIGPSHTYAAYCPFPDRAAAEHGHPRLRAMEKRGQGPWQKPLVLKMMMQKALRLAACTRLVCGREVALSCCCVLHAADG
jgi:hypothetical protein